MEQRGAHGGQGGEMGHGGIDFGGADFVARHLPGDFHLCGGSGHPGAEAQAGEGGLDRGQVAGRHAAPEHFRGDGAVMRAGVDMEQRKARGEGPGGGGFAGGGTTVDGDEEEGRGGAHYDVREEDWRSVSSNSKKWGNVLAQQPGSRSVSHGRPSPCRLWLPRMPKLMANRWSP
jgi:hypothetical protein